ncbi:MAG: hypothetical protein HYV32_00670 [Candidatus Kerfeldbacteria bacterium]|nr:hypothetical protein [Candidatus Kerfeldbacteria bacterium]
MSDTISAFGIILSLVAIGISVYSWHKSRVIYDIEKFKFPKRVGDSKTDNDQRLEKALKEKLKSGTWQILHIYDCNEEELMVVIGKTKRG